MLANGYFGYFLFSVAEILYSLQKGLLIIDIYILISWIYCLIVKYIGKDDNQNVSNYLGIEP